MTPRPGSHARLTPLQRDAPASAEVADRDILDEPLLDAADVARLLGIPKASVYEYARDGRLPCVCIGRHRKFIRRDLSAAIARMRTG